MRRLLAIALCLTAALSYFFLADLPAAPLDAHIEREFDRAWGVADPHAGKLSGVTSTARREVAAVPAMGELSVAADEPVASLTARILVTVQPKGAFDAAPPLAGLRVRASSLKTKSCFDGPLVTADGQAEIRVDSGGRYRVEVDPASVPEGYVASGKYRLGFLDESGVAGAFVEVEDGQVVHATLTIFRTSSVSGMVTGPAGGLLEGITVRAQGLAPGMAGMAHDAVTDAAGEFELAGLLPFVYGVNIVDTGSHAGALETVPQPARQLFDLQYGPYEGVHLSIGSGRITLAGTVTDEVGAPFEDVSVRAYYVGDEAHGVALSFPRAYDWSDRAFLTRTNAVGEFRVAGLRGVPVRIQVGAEEAKNGPGRRAKFVPKPVEVALGSESPVLVKVGPIELTRSRRFVVQGNVALSAADYPELRLKHSRVELRAQPYAQGPDSAKRPGMESRPFIDYDKRTGAFTLSCDTPLDDCTLTLALRGHPSLDKGYRFQPAPDETLTGQVLSFP